MPFVKISKDAHKDMKQFLVDIKGLTLGELIECAFEYAMENLKEFEEFLELDADEKTDDEEPTSEEETENEDEEEE